MIWRESRIAGRWNYRVRWLVIGVGLSEYVTRSWGSTIYRRDKSERREARTIVMPDAFLILPEQDAFSHYCRRLPSMSA